MVGQGPDPPDIGGENSVDTDIINSNDASLDQQTTESLGTVESGGQGQAEQSQTATTDIIVPGEEMDVDQEPHPPVPQGPGPQPASGADDNDQDTHPGSGGKAAMQKALKSYIPPETTPGDTPGKPDLKNVLSRWVAQDKASRTSSHFYYRLTHRYSEDNLSLKSLKTVDHALASKVTELVTSVPLEAFLAILEKADDDEAQQPYLVRKLLDFDGHGYAWSYPMEERTLLPTELAQNNLGLGQSPNTYEAALVLIPRDTAAQFFLGLSKMTNATILGGGKKSRQDLDDVLRRYGDVCLENETERKRLLPVLRDLVLGALEMEQQMDYAMLSEDVFSPVARALSRARDWESLERVATLSRGRLALSVQNWAGVLIKGGHVALGHVEKWILTSVDSSTSIRAKCEILKQFLTGSASADEVRSWTLNILTSNILEKIPTKGLVFEDGSSLVTLLFLLLKTGDVAPHLTSLANHHASQTPFMVGAIVQLNKSLKKLARPAITKLFTKLSKKIIDALDLSKLCAPTTIPFRELIASTAATKQTIEERLISIHSLSDSPMQPIEPERLAEFISALLDRKVDDVVFSQLAFKIVGKASIIHRTKFVSLWLPFLQQLVSVLETNKITLSTSRYRHIFAAILEAYISSSKGPRPKVIEWISDRSLSCLCRHCADIRMFFIDTRTEYQAHNVTIEEFNHIERYCLGKNNGKVVVEFEAQTRELKVTKKGSYTPETVSDWALAAAKARVHLCRFDSLKLKEILGDEFNRIWDLEDLALPEAPVEFPAMTFPAAAPGERHSMQAVNDWNARMIGQHNRARIAQQSNMPAATIGQHQAHLPQSSHIPAAPVTQVTLRPLNIILPMAGQGPALPYGGFGVPIPTMAPGPGPGPGPYYSSYLNPAKQPGFPTQGIAPPPAPAAPPAPLRTERPNPFLVDAPPRPHLSAKSMFLREMTRLNRQAPMPPDLFDVIYSKHSWRRVKPAELAEYEQLAAQEAGRRAPCLIGEDVYVREMKVLVRQANPAMTDDCLDYWAWLGWEGLSAAERHRYELLAAREVGGEPTPEELARFGKTTGGVGSSARTQVPAARAGSGGNNIGSGSRAARFGGRNIGSGDRTAKFGGNTGQGVQPLNNLTPFERYIGGQVNSSGISSAVPQWAEPSFSPFASATLPRTQTAATQAPQPPTLPPISIPSPAQNNRPAPPTTTRPPTNGSTRPLSQPPGPAPTPSTVNQAPPDDRNERGYKIYAAEIEPSLRKRFSEAEPELMDRILRKRWDSMGDKHRAVYVDQAVANAVASGSGSGSGAGSGSSGTGSSATAATLTPGALKGRSGRDTGSRMAPAPAPASASASGSGSTQLPPKTPLRATSANSQRSQGSTGDSGRTGAKRKLANNEHDNVRAAPTLRDCMAIAAAARTGSRTTLPNFRLEERLARERAAAGRTGSGKGTGTGSSRSGSASGSGAKAPGPAQVIDLTLDDD